MRTIRGKRIDNKEWVYGYIYELPLPSGDACMILTQDNNHLDNSLEPKYHLAFTLWVDLFLVDPATVGQFTGLTDKNGKEIYEGDILREPPKNEYENENYVAYEVFWHNNDCASHHIGWQMNRCHFQGCICGTMYIPEFLPKTTARMEIIGNVFDNTELIEKGGQDGRD